MRIVTGVLCVIAVSLAGVCRAQQWEVGGAAGARFMNGMTVSNAAGNAVAGFKAGAAFGAVVGHNLYSHLSGEMRYTYQMSDLRLTSGSTEATFKGVAHAVHYDLLVHMARKRSRVQPFVAFGGGVKIYRGIGKEAAYQPLNTFAYLTKTQDVKPMITAGAGIKYAINQNTVLRVEFRDYITQFPKQVIAPAPGAKIGGWLQDFVPLIGISFTF